MNCYELPQEAQLKKLSPAKAKEFTLRTLSAAFESGYDTVLENGQIIPTNGQIALGNKKNLMVISINSNLAFQFGITLTSFLNEVGVEAPNADYDDANNIETLLKKTPFSKRSDKMAENFYNLYQQAQAANKLGIGQNEPVRYCDGAATAASQLGLI